MVDLTPELLAQLEVIASRNMPRFDHHVSDGITMAKAIPALVAAAKERDQLRAEATEDKWEIKTLSETLSDSQVDRAYLGERIDKLSEEADQLRAERDRARQEIADIRGAIDAHGHDGTFEAAARLRDEAVKLRAEVERLRGQQGASRVRDFDPLGPEDQLPADVLADVESERGMRQIERKP